MKNKLKQHLAIVLSVMMIAGTLPSFTPISFAEGPEGQVTEQTLEGQSADLDEAAGSGLDDHVFKESSDPDEVIQSDDMDKGQEDLEDPEEPEKTADPEDSEELEDPVVPEDPEDKDNEDTDKPAKGSALYATRGIKENSEPVRGGEDPGNGGDVSEDENTDELSMELSQTSFVYNGEVQQPEVVVKKGEEIIDPSGYNVEFSEGCVDAGTYDVTVTTNDEDAQVLTASFEIMVKELAPKVVLSNTSYTYNGKSHSPKVTVKDGSVVIDPEYYDVKYPKSSVNAGTYKITVTMKGNYSGNKTVSYKITKKKVTPKVTLSKKVLVYNGKARKPGVTVKVGSKKMPKSTYTVKYAKGRKNVGTYKVTVKMKCNYSGSKAVSFKIKPKKIKPSVKLSASTFEYNGQVKKPAVTVKKGSTKMTSSSYTVKYAAGRISVGTYTVKVSMKGNYSGSKTVSFKIIPRGTSIYGLSRTTNSITATLYQQSAKMSEYPVTGYQIQYGYSPNFSSVINTVTVPGYYNTSRTIGGLSAATTYYVRVRTYMTVGSATYCSNWSAARAIQTAALPPVTPAYVAPTSGIVYWTPGGAVYHLSRNCPTLSRSRDVRSGTIGQSGKPRACKVCG